MTTTTPQLADRAVLAAGLVRDMEELGRQIGHIHVTPDRVALQPAADLATRQVRVVANWASRWQTPVVFHVIAATMVHASARFTYGETPVVTFASLDVSEAWKLARLLQVDLDGGAVTVDAAPLLSVIEGADRG